MPFELRWYQNIDKKGEVKSIPLNENTRVTCKDNKIEISNGQKSVRQKRKDARVNILERNFEKKF